MIAEPDAQAALDGARQRGERAFYDWILKRLVAQSTPPADLSVLNEVKRVKRLCAPAARLAVSMWVVDQQEAA